MVDAIKYKVQQLMVYFLSRLKILFCFAAKCTDFPNLAFPSIFHFSKLNVHHHYHR